MVRASPAEMPSFIPPAFYLAHGRRDVGKGFRRVAKRGLSGSGGISEVLQFAVRGRMAGPAESSGLARPGLRISFPERFSSAGFTPKGDSFRIAAGIEERHFQLFATVGMTRFREDIRPFGCVKKPDSPSRRLRRGFPAGGGEAVAHCVGAISEPSRAKVRLSHAFAFGAIDLTLEIRPLNHSIVQVRET